MFRRLLIVLPVAAALFLSGCASTQGPREQSGMAIGAAIGGLVGAAASYSRHDDYYHGGDGYSTAAIVLGAVAGAAIGGAIGREMDAQDHARASYAMEHTRTGQPTAWHNPDTGYDYRMTPTETYYSDAGPCREYVMEARIGGRPETVYGTACRQPDGSWKIEDR
ncbi:hypothetical protein HFP89_15595 [Wenzhouxiangella sp. XN79A]|uniref:RT0821/Lpp0805 family surface protein n=1 Tax=Wenzhouxiangella sp. XN79A TaxID=2724193 RepID=UPI00144AAB1F|nr:RT0821/Lpp0805 family surface protein [Wenzhouxiangella sp. XN79A]NKI36595.1 hypothetical protein [Wenzhouxiangella sp. XN79A]